MTISNHRSQRQQSERVTESATDARQGRYGKPVLAVLVSALVLAMMAWGAAEIWGESIDIGPTPKASIAPDPINAEPHGAGTFDNDPAGGGSRPPEATDRAPTPHKAMAAVRHYPEIEAKLDQHIRETEGQIVRLEEVLDGLNEDHSSLKDMALSDRVDGRDEPYHGRRRNPEKLVRQLRL